MTNGFDTIAAEGLLDLASVMQYNRLSDAEAHGRRAVQLADQRGAKRTAARGRVQLAAIYQRQGRARDALDLLGTVLPFLRENRYRRFEQLGLSVASRAHLQLDELDEAKKISESVLSVAETVKNESQVALAATNLASVATALGHYPEALRLRLKAEDIHKRQGDEVALPYNLGNRADLLARLGRASEAEKVLDELEAGIAAKIESYVGHERRAIFFRAFAAATSLQCDDATRHLLRLETQKPVTDTPGLLGPVVGSFCEAVIGRRTVPAEPPTAREPTVARERLYLAGRCRHAPRRLAVGDGAQHDRVDASRHEIQRRTALAPGSGRSDSRPPAR